MLDKIEREDSFQTPTNLNFVTPEVSIAYRHLIIVQQSVDRARERYALNPSRSNKTILTMANQELKRAEKSFNEIVQETYNAKRGV